MVRDGLMVDRAGGRLKRLIHYKSKLIYKSRTKMKNHKNSRLKTNVRICFIVSDDLSIRGRFVGKAHATGLSRLSLNRFK